jgi:hypothetical protein
LSNYSPYTGSEAMSISRVAEAVESFRAGLQEAWGEERKREDELTQACAPLLEGVTLLLQSIATTVSEVTQEPATLAETKLTHHSESQSLVVLQCVLHPRGDFQVRLRFKSDRVEYHRERFKLSDMDALFSHISRDALSHFRPKPIQGTGSASGSASAA